MGSESTGFLRDGIRRIDIVLVISDEKYDEKVDKIKIDFLMNVIKVGLDVEVEPAVMRRHENMIFVKVHAPDPIIEEYGRYYNVKKYFKKIHNEFINPYSNLFYMKNESELIITVRKEFFGPSNYTNVERSTIVYHILLSLPFGQYENHVGIERLIERNIILDAYALHDGPYFFIGNTIQKNVNARQVISLIFFDLLINKKIAVLTDVYTEQIKEVLWMYKVLYYTWFGKFNLFRRQPIHLIREYFGEKVGFYFAFYDFFNLSLIFATVLGIFVTIESFYDIKDDDVIKEACSDDSVMNTNADKVKTVCPLCRNFDICPFRNLSDYCVKVTITNFIDNPGTMIYCILISLWAMLVILLWRRRRNYISWLWEYDQTDEIKFKRSEFRTNVTKITISKLTGIISDTDTIITRISRLILTILFFMLWAFIVLVITIFLITCKYELSAKFSYVTIIWRDYLAVITITCVYISIMSILQKFSNTFSYLLTRFENHKTHNSFGTAFITKLFGFSFICNFTLLIYYYFLNVLYTYPSDKSRWYWIGGIGMMNCGPENCLDEQCVALVVSILVNQYLINFPLLFLKPKTDYNQSGPEVPSWEREYLLKPFTEFVLTKKINDLVLKFTLVGLFGTTFALTPLLLLISGGCMIRHEARQFLVARRRPLLIQPGSQHVWYKIMLAVVYAVPCFNTMAMTFMATMLHYSRNSHESSYFEFSMGKFITEDYKKVRGPGSPAEAIENYKGFVPAQCLFPGLRYRSKKLDGEYYPVERFWRIRYDKHRLMLEVEHLALLLMVILHCAIPAYPRDITETLIAENRIKRRKEIGQLNIN